MSRPTPAHPILSIAARTILSLCAGILCVVGLSSCSLPEQQSDLARYNKAITKLDSSGSTEDHWYALSAAAKDSFEQGHYDDARKYAKELEKLTPQFRGNWNYGNAIQDYNLVLGRLALRDKDIRSAEDHLLKAGRSPGSPQMDSFGPNMSLAKDLLEAGQRQVVLEYFEMVRKFWAPHPKTDELDRMHDQELSQWAAEVKAGKIPDFGANLIY
ncbi:MAG: tetratricopeptide repeat protein [Chthoniobacterales bacterium]